MKSENEIMEKRKEVLNWEKGSKTTKKHQWKVVANYLEWVLE